MRIIFPAFILLYLLSIISVQASESTASDKNYTTSNSNVGHVNQSFNIRVVIDHVFIKQENNSIKISESVVFRNEGPEIYYSKDNHTFFAISTPHDLKDLQTLVMECCLVQEEGAVFMDPMQPIKPGENFEMQVSYTLLPRGLEYVFNKSTIYNTTSLLMFVDKKSGLVGEGPHETLTLQGNEYNVIAFNNLRAGKMVSVPIRMTQGQGFLYATIGLFLLFSTGLVYYYKIKILGKTRKKSTLDELEIEKKKVFHAIRSFEKHAGVEKSEEYERLMEEYRQKAIQIFIKMDKIRNKI